MSARREKTEGIDRAHTGEPLAPALLIAVDSAGTSDPAPASSGASGASGASGVGPAFVSGTHAALFVAADENRCDVCDQVVDEDSDEGYAVAGRGLYVWARGEDVRYEEPHLCPSCAAAVGVSALARWEIEEEEG